jgi:aryl-alcohol dehydrogenase-like predicted oxidoreductase
MIDRTAPWLVPRQQAAPPVLAVGTMNFGKRTPEPDCKRIVDRALERGLGFFDTANVYNDGESERILGRALGKSRSRALVATKVGLAGGPKNPEGLSAPVVLRAAEDSLRRLGTDTIDVYYLHAPDLRTPIGETLDAMKTLLDAGKIKSWAVSNFASWQVLEIDTLCDQRAMPRPVLSQVMYNLLVRQIEIEHLAFARRYPIHVTVYNPLAGGLLAGKHRMGEIRDIPKGSRFDSNRMYQRRYWTARFFEQVDAIALVARQVDLTPAELAYAWLAGRTGVDSILVGPADVAQLDVAVTACSIKLSPDTYATLDAMYVAFQGTDARYAR